MKNVDEVLKLFSEYVEYYETPTQKLQDKEEIRNEWQNIHDQENIKLDLDVCSSIENKHTVEWHLEYKNNNEQTVLNGIYLIKLNEDNLCTEFCQYCQIE